MTSPLPGIENLPLSSLKRYLAATGWRRRSLPNNNELFSLEKDEDIEIVLPVTAGSKDLFERLSDAVATLMPLQKRSFYEIVTAVRSISFDLIRSRLPETTIRHNTISLGVAEDFIRRMTRLLAASAHGELHVGPYFQRISSTALNYASDCRFGHTFKGSFGFSIESPIGPNTLAVGDLLPAPPLSRRTVIRVARGLRQIEKAIKEEKPSSIVENYKEGLNANACEELIGLLETPQINEVIFDLTFSPEWGLPKDLESSPHAKIERLQAVDIIRDAASSLRVLNYDKQRTIIGKVRTLHSMEDSPAELFSISGLQDIMVEWDSAEFGRRLVRISLGPQEYLLAMEAHRTGYSVTVFGELERSPLRLENARDLKILN